MLETNLAQLRRTITAECASCHRNPSEVKIIPAGKTISIDTLNTLPSLGIDTVGENRVQELLEKYPNALPTLKWHFIGQLQTNKVKYLIDKVQMIHSVDRVSLAQEINKQAQARGLVMPILMEINIARNETHGGVLPNDAEAFAETLQSFPHLSLRGLMAVLPPEGVEQAAAEMKDLKEGLAKKHPSVVELSMGMSGDYLTAIRYGATIIRPGRVLFGARVYPPR